MNWYLCQRDSGQIEYDIPDKVTNLTTNVVEYQQANWRE